MKYPSIYAIIHILLIIIFVILLLLSFFPIDCDKFHNRSSGGGGGSNGSESKATAVFSSSSSKTATNRNNNNHEKEESVDCGTGYKKKLRVGKCIRNLNYPNALDHSMIDQDTDICNSIYDKACGNHDADPLNYKQHSSIYHLNSEARADAEELLEHSLSDADDHPGNPLRTLYYTCLGDKTADLKQQQQQRTTKKTTVFSKLSNRLLLCKRVEQLSDVLSEMMQAGVSLPFELTLCTRGGGGREGGGGDGDLILHYCLRPLKQAIPTKGYMNDIFTQLYSTYSDWSMKHSLEFIDEINSLYTKLGPAQGMEAPVINSLNLLSPKGLNFKSMCVNFLLSDSSSSSSSISISIGSGSGDSDSDSDNNIVIDVHSPEFFNGLSQLSSDKFQNFVHYLLYKLAAHANGFEVVSIGEESGSQQLEFMHVSGSADEKALSNNNRGTIHYCKTLLRVVLHAYIDDEMSVSRFSGSATNKIYTQFEAVKQQVLEVSEKVHGQVGISDQSAECLRNRLQETKLVLGKHPSLRSLLMKKLQKLKKTGGGGGEELKEAIAFIRRSTVKLYQEQMKKFLGKPINVEWFSFTHTMLPQTIPSAYYVQELNSVFLTAAFVAPPMFSLLYNGDSCYSRLGFVLAHELSHAVDSNAMRQLHQWCNTVPDSLSVDTMKLENKIACVAMVVQDDMSSVYDSFVPAARIINEVFCDLVSMRAVSNLSRNPNNFFHLFSQAQCMPMNKADAEMAASRLTHAFPKNRVDTSVASASQFQLNGKCGQRSRMGRLSRKIEKCNLF